MLDNHSGVLHHYTTASSWKTGFDNKYIPLPIQGPLIRVTHPPLSLPLSLYLSLFLFLSLRVSIKPLTTILHRSSPLFSFRSITGSRSSIIIISRGEQVIDTIRFGRYYPRERSCIDDNNVVKPNGDRNGGNGKWWSIQFCSVDGEIAKSGGIAGGGRLQKCRHAAGVQHRPSPVWRVNLIGTFDPPGPSPFANRHLPLITSLI